MHSALAFVAAHCLACLCRQRIGLTVGRLLSILGAKHLFVSYENKSFRPPQTPWLLTVVALVAAVSSPELRAEGTEPLALNKRERIVGKWQSLCIPHPSSEGVTLILTFSEKGKLEISGTKGGEKVPMNRTTYSVDSAQWPMRVTVGSGEDREGWAIAVLPNDLMIVWESEGMDYKFRTEDAIMLARESK